MPGGGIFTTRRPPPATHLTPPTPDQSPLYPGPGTARSVKVQKNSTDESGDKGDPPHRNQGQQWGGRDQGGERWGARAAAAAAGGGGVGNREFV